MAKTVTISERFGKDYAALVEEGARSRLFDLELGGLERSDLLACIGFLGRENKRRNELQMEAFKQWKG